MARTEKVELTTLCLVHSEDAYLLQNRVKEDWKMMRKHLIEKEENL